MPEHQIPENVQAAIDACTVPVRQGLLVLRGLVLARAAQLPHIGPIVENLRWGQPAFLTPLTGAACSLRIGPVRPDEFGLFVHCQSGLIPAFAAGPGSGMRTSGTRAVLFRSTADIDAPPLSLLIGQALTFHLSANSRAAKGAARR